jgi:DNA-binding NarL/FixJ family response regulator
MQVLIIEDDYLEADNIEVSLRKNFEHVKVNKIGIESESREKLKGIETDRPDLIVWM